MRLGDSAKKIDEKIQFLAYKSLLSPIVVGFEPLETWGIDGGIQGFNYFVEWTDRMPIHAHFTF